MGLGDEVDRQLRLHTHGVQARGVHNHQPLPEQRMRHIDQGVAPFGDFHQPLRIHQRVFHAVFIAPETQLAGFVHRHLAYLRHMGHGLRQLVGIIHIQRQLHPGGRALTPLGQAVGLSTCFDG